MRALEILAVLAFGLVVAIGATNFVAAKWGEVTPQVVEALR